MNVIPEWNADQLDTAVLNPDASDSDASPETVGLDAPPETDATQAGEKRELMAGLAASVRDLAEASQGYHARAQHREEVIDHLRSEVDRLRRGERRTLLRPLLTEMSRLRNDLLRQAAELPADFGAERAALLLRSYAESMGLALENSGVVSFAPDSGDAFDPRMHRRVGGQPAADPALTGRIAHVRRDGYLDVDANSPVALAEVVVFAAADPQSTPDRREEQ
jgi:hypothetical protein